MAHETMNRSQELLHEICLAKQLVCSKHVAHRLHRHATYISDICTRDRVDFVGVFNEILRGIEPALATNFAIGNQIASPILNLLMEGTNWVAYWYNPAQRPNDFPHLCQQTGVLLEDLGGAIKTLAAIEGDGKIDDADDVHIEEFCQKVSQLQTRLAHMTLEVKRRRAEKASKT